MRDGVADLHFLAGLDAGDDVSYIACRQLGAGHHVELEDAYFVGMVFLTGSHEFHKIVLADSAVYYLEISYDAAERVEYRVEDKSLQWRLGVAYGCGYALHNGAEYVGHAYACLSRCADDFLALAAEQVYYLVFDLFGIGRVEVYLVDYGNNLEVVVDSHIQVRDSLRLYALRGIHNEQSALARGYRARDLVGEVHVPRGVDKVEHITGAVELIPHLYSVALDSDAALALQIHVVEHLRLHILGSHRIGIFKQTVGQGRLTMVDVSYNTKVADIFHSKRYLVQNYEKNRVYLRCHGYYRI